MEKHNTEKTKMKNLKNEGLETMETKVRLNKGWRVLFALVLAAAILTSAILAPHPAEAACPAPGGTNAGALNMVHDATMLTIPMIHDAPQGNAGMTTAVNNSSCP
jgi:hypothetical protein